MKISTFILLIGVLCIFYIYNAEWIDEWYETFVEDYLGSDYEEVAPFISSVESGTEEFDHSIEESARFYKDSILTPYTLTFIFALLTVLVLTYQSVILLKENPIFRSTQGLINRYCQSLSQTKDDDILTRRKQEVQSLLTEVLERNLKQFRNRKPGDEVPVQLLWKGGSIVESSVHCNLRGSSNTKHPKSSEIGGGDEPLGNVSRTSSEESTTAKMAEIRRLLESEPEIIRNFVDKCAGKEEVPEEMISQLRQRLESELSPGKSRRRSDVVAQAAIPQQLSPRISAQEKGIYKQNIRNDTLKEENLAANSDEHSTDADNDLQPDAKLMNRIRLLESRLRLEELKNRTWINRMTRAEEILQQLNKQVERIEESRPLETRTEMLKITSTVTNWPPGVHPKRNMQYTLVNQSPPYYLQQPYMSLSDIIKREIGLPSSGDYNRNRIPLLPPIMQIPTLPSPTTTITTTTTTTPQSSFLSKFLSK